MYTRKMTVYPQAHPSLDSTSGYPSHTGYPSHIAMSSVSLDQARPGTRFLSTCRLETLLKQVSRTFALSNRLLPRRFRLPMTIAYLIFRVSDYLEDNVLLARREKAELLRHWANVLAGTESLDELESALHALPVDGCEAEVASLFPAILGSLSRLRWDVAQIIRNRARETTIGMGIWQTKGPRIRTESDMDEYMHYVAGVVGLMITDVFGRISYAVRVRRRKLKPLAREYGLGLQTVNIVRGLKKDHERGWLYVPAQFCADVGLDPDELFRSASLGKSLEVLARIIVKAEGHLEAGLQYVQMLPRALHRVRVATMWPLMFAAKTLSLARDNPEAFLSEAKMTRRDVRRIVRHTAVMGWSNLWIRWYYRKLLG